VSKFYFSPSTPGAAAALRGLAALRAREWHHYQAARAAYNIFMTRFIKPLKIFLRVRAAA